MERKVVWTLRDGTEITLENKEISIDSGESYVRITKDYWEEFKQAIQEVDKELK